MRILFANHTGAWSGAEVSLMRLVAGLREEHDVARRLPGRRAAGRRGRPRRASSASPLPAVDASLRLHPIQTPVGVGAARVPAAWRSRAPRAASART